jgi:DNA-binding CsgD family transcriptional regulator
MIGTLNNQVSKLTAAEKKILALISQANSNKEIAAVLGISPATVKRHVENILRKAHLKNRVQPAIYGLTMVKRATTTTKATKSADRI